MALTPAQAAESTNVASEILTITPTVPTLTNGTNYIGSNSSTYYYKVGTRVHLTVSVSGLTADTEQLLFTLPQGYRPKYRVYNRGIASTGLSDPSPYIIIQPNGYVYAKTSSAYGYLFATIEFDAFA